MCRICEETNRSVVFIPFITEMGFFLFEPVLKEFLFLMWHGGHDKPCEFRERSDQLIEHIYSRPASQIHKEYVLREYTYWSAMKKNSLCDAYQVGFCTRLLEEMSDTLIEHSVYWQQDYSD